jgi:hypothetical protein
LKLYGNGTYVTADKCTECLCDKTTGEFQCSMAKACDLIKIQASASNTTQVNSTTPVSPKQKCIANNGGEFVESYDGCVICKCLDSGETDCKAQACASNPAANSSIAYSKDRCIAAHNGQASFKAADGVNTCTCEVDGEKCTLIAAGAKDTANATLFDACVAKNKAAKFTSAQGCECECLPDGTEKCAETCGAITVKTDGTKEADIKIGEKASSAVVNQLALFSTASVAIVALFFF